MLSLLMHARKGSLLSVLLLIDIVLPLCFVTIYEIRDCFIVTLTFSKRYSIMLSEFDKDNLFSCTMSPGCYTSYFVKRSSECPLISFDKDQPNTILIATITDNLRSSSAFGSRMVANISLLQLSRLADLHDLTTRALYAEMLHPKYCICCVAYIIGVIRGSCCIIGYRSKCIECLKLKFQ
jgi:hypothetical protein